MTVLCDGDENGMGTNICQSEYLQRIAQRSVHMSTTPQKDKQKIYISYPLKFAETVCLKNTDILDSLVAQVIQDVWHTVFLLWFIFMVHSKSPKSQIFHHALPRGSEVSQGNMYLKRNEHIKVNVFSQFSFLSYSPIFPSLFYFLYSACPILYDFYFFFPHCLCVFPVTIFLFSSFYFSWIPIITSFIQLFFLQYYTSYLGIYTSLSLYSA